jgi:hypothetical protein
MAVRLTSLLEQRDALLQYALGLEERNGKVCDCRPRRV